MSVPRAVICASSFVLACSLPEMGRFLSGSSRSDYRVEGPVAYYQAKYVLPANAEEADVPPPMEVATEENMDPALAKLGIDFEGIWWMSDNPVPEELVSFANTKVILKDGGFPATLMVPNSRKGMWSWLTNTIGTVLRKYYASGDPDSHTDFVFNSPEEGFISTGLTDVPLVWVESFPFHKYTENCDETSGSTDNCDPTDCAPTNKTIYDGTCADLIKAYPNDMWSRPTTFQDGSIFSDTTYTLKRIVMGDGSPHPVFWDEFMEHMTSKETCPWNWWWWGVGCTPGVRGEKEMQSYVSDDWCERKHAAIWGSSWFGC